MTPQHPRIIVVNGHSNAGKSTFCGWLAENQGFLHVDCDDRQGPTGITGRGLRPAWTQVEMGNPAPLLAEVEQRGQSIVLDWPFNPPHSFGIVTCLRDHGVPAWWLDADRGAAHTSFVARAQGNIADFILHATCVDLHRAVLPSLYGGRYLMVLRPDGSRLSPDAVWDVICKVEGW